MSTIRRPGTAAALLLLVALAARPASALTPEEVKAAFVFNFVKFTDWPAPVFRDAQSPITVCVVEGPPAVAAAFGTLAGRSVRGRELRVQPLEAGDPLAGCQVAFLAEGVPAADYARRLRGQPVLAIGDGAGAAEAGVIIGLAPADRRLGIVVNADALAASQLTLSSQVLGLARIVHDGAR